MRTWLKRAIVALLIVVACGTTSSGATYTASSTNPQSFAAAADFGLSVTLDDPGATMRGSRTLSANPVSTDGVAIASVRIQRAPAGTSSWTTVCTVSAAPHQCALDTTTLSDGQYDFRASATNANGYTRSSPTVSARLVDNTAPSIVQEDPGAWFRGTLTLRAQSVGDGAGGSGVAGVVYQYRVHPAGAWATACSATSSPFSCTFATSGLTDGAGYDFRAVATDVAGNATTTAAFLDRRPDNANPDGSLADVGTNRRGTIAVTLSGTDAHSGVASVVVQYTTAGGSTWSTGCVDTTTPFTSCSWDTTPLDGVYDVHAVVTDTAGNTYTTAAYTSRRIDNGLPTVTLDDPSSPLSGSVTLNSTASDGGSGIESVTTQYSVAGSGAWANACPPDTVPPYSTCTANSTGVSDGLYDFRAVGQDVAGNVAYATVTDRRVDNYVPSASDVQTANGGGTPGVIQTGDSITLTYSEAIDPSSIVAGWDGSGSQSVHARFTHAGAGDRVLFYNAANTVTIPLATGTGVDLKADYVPNTNATYAATLTRSASGAAFTVTLGARTAGSVNAAAPGAATMQWSPSSGARDFLSKQCSTTVRAETGAADAEF